MVSLCTTCVRKPLCKVASDCTYRCDMWSARTSDYVAALEAALREREAQLREREAECERLDSERVELKNLVQQWEDWLASLQADFAGVTDGEGNDRLHDWEWIEEHRCWPPCICEES